MKLLNLSKKDKHLYNKAWKKYLKSKKLLHVKPSPILKKFIKKEKRQIKQHQDKMLHFVFAAVARPML